jgi:RHS repeat-associated protein
VQFLLDGNGDVLDKYTYDAFGKPKIMDGNGAERTTTSNGNRFLFTGREYLSALGLYDYRHRVYHPGLGRFLQVDPMGLHIEGAKLSAQQTALYVGGTAPGTFSSSELNLYRYCLNDPVNGSDPFGLETKIYPGGESPWATNYNPTDRTVMVAHGNPRQGAVDTVSKTIIYASTIAKDAISLGFSAEKPKVDLSICGAGVGGKNSLAQKVANELAARTGVQPELRAVDGNTANQAYRNDTTGAIRSDPLAGAPDPETKGTTGEIKHFTAEPKKEIKKDKNK